MPHRAGALRQLGYLQHLLQIGCMSAEKAVYYKFMCELDPKNQAETVNIFYSFMNALSFKGISSSEIYLSTLI